MDLTWAEYWRDYRKTTGALTWRLATSEDVPGIRRLRSISERFLDKPQRNISLFEWPVMIAWVAENNVGMIVDCVYIEAQVEVVKVSCARRSLDEAAALQEDIEVWLGAKGFRTIWVTTLPRLKHTMGVVLEKVGLKCLDGVLACWRKRI